MTRILLVEDEANIRDVCRRYLQRAGFAVTEAADGEAGLELFHRDKPHLMVVDLMLPKRDGYQVCQEIRQLSDVPIVMLTARGDEFDRVMGLTLGADDYITKPFSPRELVLRVQNILRRVSYTEQRQEEEEDVKLISEGILIDPTTRRVTIEGRDIDLTAKEFDVLYTMARRPGTVYSKGQLLELVWGFDTDVDTGAVTVLIRRLREKIERDASQPRFVHTVWGIGYRFEAAAAPGANPS